MNKVQEFSIRLADLHDVDLVAPLFDAYRQFYRKPPDLTLAKTFLSERLERKESIILIALDAGGVAIGFTQLFPSFSSGAAARIYVLNDLFVIPSARRTGVGKALLRAAAQFARSQGAVRLTLSTEITNKTAQALYEAEGWKVQADYYVYTLSLD